MRRAGIRQFGRRTVRVRLEYLVERIVESGGGVRLTGVGKCRCLALLSKTSWAGTGIHMASRKSRSPSILTEMVGVVVALVVTCAVAGLLWVSVIKTFAAAGLIRGPSDPGPRTAMEPATIDV